MNFEARMATRQSWPTAIDYDVYHSQDVPAAGQRNVVRGRTWYNPGLEAEIPNPGDFRSTHVGQTPVVLVRGPMGRVHASIKGMLVDRGVALRRANVFPEHYSCHLISRSMIAGVDGNAVRVQAAMPFSDP